MKMTRNLIILGVVLALAVALVIVAPSLKPAVPSATPRATADITQLQLSVYTADKVSEVTVENSKQTYTVYKKGDKYVVKGQEGLNLDQPKAGSVFYSAANVVGEKLIEMNPKDLSVYGLDKPQAKITAKYTDGTTNVFLLGSETVAGNTHYVMKQGGDRVVTIWMNFGSTFLGTVDSLLAKGGFTLTQEEIETIRMTKKGEVALELTSLGVDNKVSISPWSIVQPWKRSVDSQQLEAFMQEVLAVAMGEVVEGDAKDLAKYGLDKPEAGIVISGKGKTDELLIGADKDDYNAYAKFAGSNMVYTVSKSSLEFIKTTPYKLMDKMIILVHIANAVGLEFKGLGTQGKMVIEHKPALDDKGEKKLDGNGDPMFDQFFSINGKAIEDKVARYFYQVCIGLSTHSLVKEGWQPSGEPVAVLTYYRNTDPTVIKVEFMAYDKDFYAVRMDGGTYFLIRQEKVQKVADDMAKLVKGELTAPQN